MATDDPGHEELAHWLTTKVAGYLNVPPSTVDAHTPLADCGIDSVAAIALCTDLQCEKGFVVDTTIVWDYPTIDAIATHLVTERSEP